MSAVLSHQASTQTDVGARLAFQKQLQAVTNKIHATNNIDEIMLEVSADVCALFNADRLTIYSIGEDKQAIVSKVKTGLNSFKDLKLPIAEHSIAGYAAFSKKTINIKDCYDDAELRGINPNLRFLQEVDKRTGYRTKQQLVAPISEQGTGELIGVIQIINNKAGVPFGALAEEGVSELAQTLAIAFKQRQKPMVVKTKYDYLIADAVLSGGRHRAGAGRRVPGQDPRHWRGSVEVFRRTLRGLQVRPHQAGRAAEEPEARVRRAEPLGADRRQQGWPGGDLPRPRARPLLAHRLERLPEGAHRLSRHDAEGIQGNRQPVLRPGEGRRRFRRRQDARGRRPPRGRRGGRRGIRRGRQRAGEAGEQGDRRRLQPGRLGHPYRALPGEGEDRDPLPQGRLARRLPRDPVELPRGARRPDQDHVRPRHLGEEEAAGRQDQVQEIRPARHRAAGGDHPHRGRRRGHRDADSRRAISRACRRRCRNPTACSSSAAQPARARRRRCTRY